MTKKTIKKGMQGKKVVVGFLVLLLALSVMPAGLTLAEPTDGDVTILSAEWTTGGPAGVDTPTALLSPPPTPIRSMRVQ